MDKIKHTQNLQTIEQLKRSILVFSVLSILIVGAIVAIAAIYPLFNQLKKEEARNLLHAATSKKMVIEQFLGRLEQTAWQITSRTKVREKLEQYNRGEVSLQQLVDFGKPILEDALHISKAAVGCLRFDKNGKPVVEAGLPIPEPFRVLPREEETTARMQGPVFMANALYVVVGVPIFDREKIRVGTDLVMFQLDELRIIVQNGTGLGETGEAILGVVADKTRVRLFFPSRKTAEKFAGYVGIESPLGLAIEQASHLGRDEFRLLTPASDRSQVFACASIAHINNWAMVVRMNAKELYAPINKQVIIILFVILVLLLLGTLAAILLLRPLAGKIVIHAEQLESMTQRLVREAEERWRLQEELSRNYHDIQETARQLEQSRNMLQLILESIPVRVFWKDCDSRFLGCNTLFARDAGFSRPEQLLGQDDSAMGWREHSERYQADDRQVMASARPKMNIVEPQTTPAGDTIWLNTSKVPLQMPDGEVIGVLGVYEDITERKQTEAELKRIEWMLSKQHTALQEQVNGPDQAYGDLTALNRDGLILKSVGREVLRSISTDYLDLLGTSSAIYEVNGDYAFGIFTSNWCRMMDLASRKLCDANDNAAAMDSGQWLCHESCWTCCSKETIMTRAPVDIACSGGIRLYGVPIVAHETVIGSINFGYGDAPKDPVKLRALAAAYHLDYEDLLAAADTYDARPPYIVEMAKSRLHASAKLIGIMVERKQAEQEVRKLNRELDRRVLDRTAELEAANKELDAFAYTVSHDLRAPLRHIDGFIALLQKKAETALDEQSRHYMNTISDAAKKMELLIDDLLSFSRMGRQTMAFKPVDLGPLVRDVIRELGPDAAGRDIEWRIGDLAQVSGDAAMLRIVLANLIANALKFTRPRKLARIEIGLKPNQGSGAVIFVRDNGVGFDMTYADKLFGVFQRLHRIEEFEGTGIGLATVHRIIARHGGRIWAEGSPDQGATFFFSLPHTGETMEDDLMRQVRSGSATMEIEHDFSSSGTERGMR